jgi:ABC-type Zn uptake system ZnuABC Zn-binding protein ZnuA
MFRKAVVIFMVVILLASCQGSRPSNTGNHSIKVLAAESFLADIAQNVAGDKFQVDTLIPTGVDPHGFEVTPQDLVKINNADILILNGCGFESWIENILKNPSQKTTIIEACKGLTSRTAGGSELSASEQNVVDPHFWMDPNLAMRYVENIRNGFIVVDPTNKASYDENGNKYIQQLKELDSRIQNTVNVIPPEQRKIVTNHESFGYFADRYHFQIIGTILASVSSSAAPSAQQMTALVDQIRRTGTRAIFLETGSNPQLANQLAQETNIKVISDLYTHSLTPPDGAAPTYIAMMKWDTQKIVEALNQK